MVRKVKIREVGPREGLQSFKKIVTTEQKLELIGLLALAGVPEIEVTSFVRAERVPQMADAEDLVRAIPDLPNTATYRALYLNQVGFKRACKFDSLCTEGWLYTAASDKFLKNNSNTDHQSFIQEIPSWIELFKQFDKTFRGLMISTAFGSNDQGAISPDKVISVLSKIRKKLESCGVMPIELSLADTMGWATPETVVKLIDLCKQEFGEIEISLHLHDTRGTAMANACAGLEAGVRIFESSVGGVGGCPFAPGASGNIVTEDLVWMLESMGYSTGINLERYMEANDFLSRMGLEPEGKLYRSWKAGVALSC